MYDKVSWALYTGTLNSTQPPTLPPPIYLTAAHALDRVVGDGVGVDGVLWVGLPRCAHSEVLLNAAAAGVKTEVGWLCIECITLLGRQGGSETLNQHTCDCSTCAS